MHFSRTATPRLSTLSLALLTHVHPIDREGEVDNSELRWESHFVDYFEVRNYCIIFGNYHIFKSGRVCANFYLVLRPTSE